MKKFKQIMENRFESLSNVVFQNPKKTLLCMAIFMAILLLHLPRLRIDVSTEGFFREGDTTYLKYKAFQDEFGRDTAIIAALSPPSIFDNNFLLTLKAFHEDLENEVPYLDDVTSLYNVTSIRGEGNELITEDLLKKWPQNKSELESWKKLVMSTPLYKNYLISEAGDFTLVSIRADVHAGEGEENFTKITNDDFIEEKPGTPENELSFHDKIMNFLMGKNPVNKNKKEFPPDSGVKEKTAFTQKQLSEFVTAVRKVAARYQSENFPILLAGDPIMDELHIYFKRA